MRLPFALGDESLLCAALAGRVRDGSGGPVENAGAGCGKRGEVILLARPALPDSSTLAVMIVIYLMLIALGKIPFCRARPRGRPVARRGRPREHRVHHRATR